MTNEELEQHVAAARDGDAAALERVVHAVMDLVHDLATRMLWCPDDAADATQEILIRVATRLSTYRGEAAFRTWVYRVATNHLLDFRKSRVERQAWTFDTFAADLASTVDAIAAPASYDADQTLLEEEVKVGCTRGMLLCLSRDDRIAYVLGDVFQLHGDDAAYVCSVSPAAFRQRLARARSRLRGFMTAWCGHVDEAAPCRCSKRVAPAIASGRVDPANLLFAGERKRALPVVESTREMDALHRMSRVFTEHPTRRPPERVLNGLRQFFADHGLRLLH